MKKMILLACLLSLVSSAAFAGGTAITASTTIGSLTFAPSNNVTVSVDSTQYGYIAGSNHSSGSRAFLTDYNASKIYWADKTATEAATLFATFVAPSAAAGACTPVLAGSASYTAL